MYSNDDQGRVYQNYKFYISHSEYVFSSSLSIYFTVIAIVLKDYDACFPIQLLIFTYYNNGPIDMQICALLTRIQCKASDTQVTVKACGPLVIQKYRSNINQTKSGTDCY